MSQPMDHQLRTSDGRMTIVFQWREDRYQHRFEPDVETMPVKMMTSVEGTPDEDWPASPAIQQLSTETIEGVPTILGVGCAGNSHFSVSVQLLDDGTAKFDWAVRMTSGDAAEVGEAQLGSTYNGDTSWPLTPLGEAVASADDVGKLRVLPGLSNGDRTKQWSYTVGFPF